MFSNLRNVTIVLFALLVVMTLIAGIYFKHTFVEGIVKVTTEEQAQVTGDTFTRSIWNRYYPVINYLSKKPANEWGTFSQYGTFTKESGELFNSQNILKTVVYSSDASILFDSAQTATITAKGSFLGGSLDKATIDNGIKVAISGQRNSIMIMNAGFKGAGLEEKKSIIKTFIPIKVTEPKEDSKDIAAATTGVLEINYDVTSTINKLDTIQFAIVFMIIASLSVLSGTVLLSTQKAEVVIEKQQEVGIEMAAAKASAETESRAKSQFLANVSHELRTPLNAIIGFSEIINSESMGPLGNDQYKEFVKDIHTSGVHLLSLINDILDFSKAEENKLQVDFEQVDLTKLIKVSIRMIMPRAEEAKVKIVDDLPTDHVVLLADPKRLKQVVLNLLSNAVKFTQEHGTVTIRAWKDNDTSSLLLEIKDTGVGMAPQDLARALAPFGQVDNKLSRRYDGTGLGLPLTKKLVELMRGRFDIKSETGLGTTITLSFPLPSNEIESADSLTAGTQGI
jgi:two-component system, cell cycle sensor histidine kinase PleC